MNFYTIKIFYNCDFFGIYLRLQDSHMSSVVVNKVVNIENSTFDK